MVEIDAFLICTEEGYETLLEQYGQNIIDSLKGVSIMQEDEFQEFVGELSQDEEDDG